jgi:hypothetical protein
MQGADEYTSWPAWARIAAPIAVVVLGLSALGAAGGGDRSHRLIGLLQVAQKI